MNVNQDIQVKIAHLSQDVVMTVAAMVLVNQMHHVYVILDGLDLIVQNKLKIQLLVLKTVIAEVLAIKEYAHVILDIKVLHVKLEHV